MSTTTSNNTEHINQSAPNTGDTIARVARTTARWTGGLVGGVMILGIGHAVLPPALDPVHLIGRTLGDLYSAEMVAQRQAAAETARRLAQSQAQAQAEAQALKESLQAQIAIGQLADMACALSGLFGQGRNSAYPDARDALRSGCGISEGIRRDITRSLTPETR